MLCVVSVLARANAGQLLTTVLLLLYYCFTTALLLRVCVFVCVPGERAGARKRGAVDLHHLSSSKAAVSSSKAAVKQQ
jgi:hypothetical protein